MGWLNLWGHDRTRRAIERQTVADPSAIEANDRHLANEIDKLRRYMQSNVQGITNRLTELVASHVDMDERLQRYEDDAEVLNHLAQGPSNIQHRLSLCESAESQLRESYRSLQRRVAVLEGTEGLSDTDKRRVAAAQAAERAITRRHSGEVLDVIEEAQRLLQRWQRNYGLTWTPGVTADHLVELRDETQAWLDARP